MAPDQPFERVVQSLPSQLTGEDRYLTDRGHVWTRNVWDSVLTNGERRGRLVNGHIVPEVQPIHIEAKAKKSPPVEPPMNRHERRAAAKKARRR